MPIPKHLDAKNIQNVIDSEKDVDGLTDINMGKLVHGRECLMPCTPLGIYECIDVFGSNVVVGRSNLVGRPMA